MSYATRIERLLLAEVTFPDWHPRFSDGGCQVFGYAIRLPDVHVPGYAALIVRRCLRDLRLPSGLIAVSHEWFAHTDARWVPEDSTWLFPSGARLVFGYLDSPTDIYRYQGTEFQFIGFDELTHFPEESYRYLFSRLRGPATTTGTPLSSVPLRMRATTNPGGEGHDWVRAWFIAPWLEHQAGTNPNPAARFYPARLRDNPHLDHDAYVRGLERLSPVVREQLLNGDWDIRPHGGLFERAWFNRLCCVEAAWPARDLPPPLARGQIVCASSVNAPTTRRCARTSTPSS